MKNSSFIHTSFIGSLIFSITGMLLMINNHVNSANLLLLIGVVFTVAFLILSVMEINKSTKLSSNQKNSLDNRLNCFFECAFDTVLFYQ